MAWNKKMRIVLAVVLLTGTVLLSSCFGGLFRNAVNPDQTRESQTNTPSSTPVPTYTVTFDLNGGTLVSGKLEQQVEEGGSATAPKAENGTSALIWEGNFDNVSSDVTITAQWEKRELDPTEIAEIVQKSTVTINCEYADSTGSGSGFFVDIQGIPGVILTSYHVIAYAKDIEIEVFEAGKYDVDTIIAFSELNDLALLRIDMSESLGLPIAEDEVRVGEKVYANGSALGTLEGTFTSGTVSSVSRTVNGVSCIQTDTAISSGNSGGPLVNSFGEVVGVNALSYTEGENLNLAVKIENMDELANQSETHYTVKEYEEWVMREVDRSYAPFTMDGHFFYSTINTYTHITGSPCVASFNSEDEFFEGYVVDQESYAYEYDAAESDAYVDYLGTKGFTFFSRQDFGEAVLYVYYNEWSGVLVEMHQPNVTDGYLLIRVYYLTVV